MTSTIQQHEARHVGYARPRVVPFHGSDRSSVADILEMMGVDVEGAVDGAEALEAPVTRRRVHAGDVLFHEGRMAEAVYFVFVGTFKTYRTAEDGYEQVLDFVGRAEVLGFDAVCSGVHPTSAVALEEAGVYSVLLADLPTLAHRVPAFDAVLHHSNSAALACRSDLADMMSAVAAEVRLARFLVHWSQRMAGQGQSPRRFRLRMSRRDIASNLGVAHETVSRSFSALSHLDLVRVDHREVEILDVDQLKAFSRRTRRQADDEAAPMMHVHKQAA